MRESREGRPNTHEELRRFLGSQIAVRTRNDANFSMRGVNVRGLMRQIKIEASPGGGATCLDRFCRQFGQ